MSYPCPLCSHKINDEVVILADRGEVRVRGDRRYFTRQQFNIFRKLFDNRPRVVTKEAMLTAIYAINDDEPDFAVKALDVRICQIRKILRGSGIEIETFWGRGWALTCELRPKIVEPVIAEWEEAQL